MALQNVWLSICFKRIQEHPHDRWISVPLFVCRWTELAQRPGGAHEAYGDTPPTSCFTSDATDILFHLGLLRALCHPLRHKANMCHLRSRCTASSTRSEHDELSIAMEYNDAGQRTRVPFVKSYYVSMATMSFKVLEWWLWYFGGRRLTGACDR